MMNRSSLLKLAKAVVREPDFGQPPICPKANRNETRYPLGKDAELGS
jgi:hypothetical protein